MAGSAININMDFSSGSSGVRTLVLVGRTGNGKSATGNSILGRKAFKAVARSSGITTRTSELQQTKLGDDERPISVIDTPGFFDNSSDLEFASKEIIKCINLAKEGIHAFLMVISARNRFTEEEEAVIRTLQDLFGANIVDYMIIVFTGGDELDYNDETLDEVLERDCPKSLKEILAVCKNRKVLFDNKTKDEHKRVEQVQQLLSIVNKVIEQNGGKPYTNELFIGRQKGKMKLQEQEQVAGSFKPQIQGEYKEDLKQKIEMVESKLTARTNQLEQKIAEEKAARLKAEELTQLAQKKTADAIAKLKAIIDSNTQLTSNDSSLQ